MAIVNFKSFKNRMVSAPDILIKSLVSMFVLHYMSHYKSLLNDDPLIHHSVGEFIEKNKLPIPDDKRIAVEFINSGDCWLSAVALYRCFAGFQLSNKVEIYKNGKHVYIGVMVNGTEVFIDTLNALVVKAPTSHSAMFGYTSDELIKTTSMEELVLEHKEDDVGCIVATMFTDRLIALAD